MSVHLVEGSDPVLRAAALDELVRELLDGEDRVLALEDFTIPSGRGGPDADAERGARGPEGGDAGDGEVVDAAGEDDDDDPLLATMAAVLNAVQSPPFMSARRVVVVRDVGSLPAAHVAPIVAYLDDPLDTTALVLVAGGGRVPDSLAKKVRATGTVAAPESEKPKEVLVREAHVAKLQLRKDAAEVIARHVGGEPGRIPALVATLVAAYGTEDALTVDDVTPYLGELGSVPVYELTNAIEAGDVPGSLAVLQRLLVATGPSRPRPMHPLQVLASLHRYYERLLRLDSPDVRRVEDAIDALGGKVKEYPAKKALHQARALRTEGLRRAFDHLHRADLDLKGARAIPGDAVLQVLVARLAALSGRSRRRR